MNRRTLALLLIVAELAIGGYFLNQRVNRPVPPEINWSRLDKATAADLRSLHQQCRSNADDWMLLGEAYLAFGFLAEADTCLAQALEWDPESFDLRFMRAYGLQRLGRLDEGIAQFKEAAAVAPAARESACWYHIGRCYLRNDAVDDAEKAFRRHPNFPPSAWQLAKILVRSGRAQEALPILDELDRRFPKGLQNRQLRTRALAALGKPEDPVVSRRAHDLSTDKLQLTDHHQYLGPTRMRYGSGWRVQQLVNLQGQGKHEQAARGFHELLETLDLDDRPRVTPMLAELDLELGRPAEAEKILNDLFEASSVTPKTLMALGDAQMMQKRPDEAMRTYERALAMRPGAELHRRLAAEYERRQELEPFKHHMSRSLCYEGIDSFREGENDKALSLLASSVEVDPAFDLAWYYLGEARMAAGNAAQAKQAYEQCLKLNPGHGRAAAALLSAG